MATAEEQSRWRIWKREQTVRLVVKLSESRQLNPSYADKLTAKAQKITVKLPWEFTAMYSEVLKQAGHQSDDEEDEDDIEAHEASIQRLKVFRLDFLSDFGVIVTLLQEADDATRMMTREEYQHYSDCRQASFTYRKCKDYVCLGKGRDN